MRHSKTDYLKRSLVSTLLVLMALSIAGCQDFGTFPPAETQPEEAEKPASRFITSEDRATLAVHEHLLGLAESHEAKTYLAEFEATSDNWTAVSELYQDGSNIWYVFVDMSGVTEWEARDYWQQAGWFVYRDGRVIPSNRLRANALRIEADLQELSVPDETESSGK